MKIKLPIILGLLFTSLCQPGFAQGTAFTYQGQLEYGGGPASGIYDLTFSMWNGPAGPTQVGSTLTNLNVTLSKGLVTVKLDFGAGLFTGTDRWLEIGIRTNGSGTFNILSPRQQITPTPYAMFAANAGGSSGNIWSVNGTNAYYTGGNVSIGSSDPHHSLRIAGGPLWTTSFWKGALELDNASAIGWRANASGNRFGIGQSGGGLYFFATGSDPGTTAGEANYLMTFDDFGKVGIGTSVPGSRLTVAQLGYGIEQTDGTVRLATYVGAGAGWLGTVNNYPLSFYVNGGGASMTINNNGSVGVGFTSPPSNETLALQARGGDVAPFTVRDSVGSDVLRLLVGAPNFLQMYGNAGKTTGGSSWIIISDARVKQDIKDYEVGLSELLQLRPVRFHYRDDAGRGLSSANEEVGFIAQEVREVIPDAVTEGKDGYLSLKADAIHWAAIRAIQELNVKIEAQREHPDIRIERLETENTELKARLTRLENLIAQLSAKGN